MDKTTHEKVQTLKELIAKYDVQYYELGKSEISDAEYDALYQTYLDYEKQYPELKEMKDSPTIRVGAGSLAGTTTGLPKFTHKSPLLSIEKKSKELSILKSFYDSIGGDGIEVIVEPKLDGITCNINYESGQFVNAATRGNGTIGDLITEQFKNTDTQFPDSIPDGQDLEIRGEAILPYDYFKEHLEKDYSNPRNAVSGILRQIEPNEVKGKGIQVMFYDIGTTTLSLDDRDAVNVRTIKDLGFQRVPCFVATCWESLREIIESGLNGMIQQVDGFNVLIDPDGVYPQAVCDGLVIKVSSLKQRAEIGMAQKGPKWAFAYKFKSLQAETRINHVEWQVGKSGRVTPVAVFDEISLGGTKITRATLNNYDYMQSLQVLSEKRLVCLDDTFDPWGENVEIIYGKPIPYIEYFKIGDFIIDTKSEDDLRFQIKEIKEEGEQGFWVRDGWLGDHWISFEENRYAIVSQAFTGLQVDDLIIVERSNDVIPRIIAIKRHQKHTPAQLALQEFQERKSTFEMPEVCPCCGSKLSIHLPLINCPNLNCSAQLKGRLEHFASRDAMNITGLGEGVIDILSDLGFLSDLPSIYALKEHEQELVDLPRFGKTKVKKLLASIEASKTPELWQFIYGLSIDGIGHHASKDLANHFLTFNGILTATMDELLKIESMGPVNAATFFDFINDKTNIDMLDRLIKVGIQPKEKQVTSNELQGKSFVITGTLDQPRKFYQDLIESKGGKVSGSVSKKTYAVLIGADAGSKETKAKELVAKGEPLILLNGDDEINTFFESIE